MKNAIPKTKLPFAYVARLVFTLIGFIYALLFTIKGMSLLIYIISNYYNSIFRGISVNEAFIEVLKYSPGSWYDSIMRILNIIVLVHAAIGSYYMLSTSFKKKPRLRVKNYFYLHLLSSIAIFIFVILLIRNSGNSTMQSGVFWGLNILIAILGGYHIGKGFFNACITLGITLGQRTRKVMMVTAWIVGGLSLLQISASLI